ncbi:hypothetical protein NQ318_009118 [Aromia moschata]|uniref:Uncharacterized protein n=1 Tax=Aromia moschata TaxID=1265417 RepID=A0AAV8XPJ2_9CUCU|nr:hypothetical protein NQ318_009118 [Aromia moschata]
MGLPLIKTKQAVDTRWNSLLIMLERLLEIKDPLSVAITNASDWSVISDCLPVLKPLELTTTELSGEKYVTMSSVIPLVRGLQHNLKTIKPVSEVGLWLQNKLIETISRRLGSLESNKIVAKTTFLDSRLRKLHSDLKKMQTTPKVG